MKQRTQNVSLPTHPRLRIAIVGGGRLALEACALLAEDPAVEVVCFWEQDQNALIFRLGELGFTFAPHLSPKFLSDIKELNETTDLDLIIDTSGNPQVRRSLDLLVKRGTRVLSGQAAKFLWEIKLGKNHGDPTEILERFQSLLEGIDLVQDTSELLEFLLQTGLLMIQARSADFYLWRPEEQEPVLIYRIIQTSAKHSNGVRSSTEFSLDPRVVQSAIAVKKPFITPDRDHPSSRETAVSSDFTERPGLILPVLMDDEVLGVIVFLRDASSGLFTPSDLELCDRLGGSSAKYIRKVLHLLEMRELSMSETIRAEIKAIQNSQSTLHEKLARGVEKIREVFGCQAHFFVKERLSDDLVLQASTTQAAQVCGMLRVRGGEGFIGGAAKSRQPVFLKGEAPGPTLGKQQSLLCLPLTTPAALWGVLCLEQLFISPGMKKTVKLLEEVAGTFAQVIAGDLEHHRMSQKLLRLSVVQEEGLELLSVTDRERLLTMITASAAMLVDAEAVVLRAFEKKGKRLLVGSTYGLHKNEMDTRLVALDALLALKTFQSRSIEVLDDLGKVDPHLPPKFPYRYGVCRPLVFEGVSVGTLSVYNKLAFQSFGCTPFDQDDLEILEKFSYYAGKALINLQETQARSALITIDELTGLRNERYLMLRLPEEIRRAERYNRSLSLMVFEVKSEAPGQPVPGSPAEKEFIKQVAEVLQEKFRNVDIVVRIKGTRFAILMPDTGETVTGAAMRLARGLASLPLKIFIGLSTYPSDAKTVQDLISKASKLSEMVQGA